VQYLAANKFMMQLITSVLSARSLTPFSPGSSSSSFDDREHWQHTKTLCEWIVRSAHSKWAETKAVRAHYSFIYLALGVLSLFLSSLTLSLGR
jgi:hypothetical protein